MSTSTVELLKKHLAVVVPLKKCLAEQISNYIEWLSEEDEWDQFRDEDDQSTYCIEVPNTFNVMEIEDVHIVLEGVIEDMYLEDAIDKQISLELVDAHSTKYLRSIGDKENCYQFEFTITKKIVQ